MSSRAALVLVLAAGLGGASCLRVRFERAVNQRALPSELQSSLEPGQPLAECLEKLGAPYFVWELPEGALAVAYAWSRASSWGAVVSAPISDNASASFDYDDLRADTQGLVLWFDPNWRLLRSERGRLRDLASAVKRQRPVLLTPRPDELDAR